MAVVLLSSLALEIVDFSQLLRSSCPHALLGKRGLGKGVYESPDAWLRNVFHGCSVVDLAEYREFCSWPKIEL